jgi:S-DNA-T family DNA segregation ATPase FtsK/SpoIIIE
MAFIGEDVIKQARKYGIIVVFATQSPTATSIPKGVTREVICRVAFSVIDQVGNDALLGDGNYKRGVRATELRPGSPEFPGDRGTSLTVGVVGGKDWSMVRGNFVNLEDAVGVVERGLDLLDQSGNGLPVTDVTDAEPPRNLLEDVSEVLGNERVNAPAMLRKLAPNWAPYKNLNGASLRTQLDKKYGVKVPSTGNRYPIDPATIREALAKQSTADLDDEG